MIQRLSNYTLPIAIGTGFLFHSFFARLNSWMPGLIFVMLYFTLNSLNMRTMKIKAIHLFILLFQIVVSLAVYFLLLPSSPVLAQGAMVLVMIPTATSAPVVAGMLGADLSTMVASTLLTNLALALIAPLYLSFVGEQAGLSFLQSFGIVLSKVAPLMIVPLLLALFTQRFLPRITTFLVRRKSISFYIWALCLTIVIGSTIDSIFALDRSRLRLILWMALISMILCGIQFAFGRWIGARYGEKVAGGQSVGQKNTVLAIWLAQTYMAPVSSVLPAFYVLWQNLFNSYQIWQKQKENRAKG
ncbi:MAG TPA: hypothetical protein PLK12_13365 [Prolixibacteraceae bacterium]|nr:hypothetical protein [Prolixibacteraceae bacterium]